MEKIKLEATVRTETGKGAARKLRREGFVPGIVYGPESEPTPIKIEGKNLIHALHAGENVLIDLHLQEDGKKWGKKKTVLVKEVQYEPVHWKIIHVDFLEVSPERAIRTHVPIVTIGEEDCAGVKAGGVLDYHLRELEIECLPSQIPEEIRVDVTELELGHSIHVADLEIPEGIRVLNDPEDTIVSVIAPAALVAEEEVAEGELEEEVEEEEAAEPEVIKQKGVEEEEEEEEES